MNKQILIIGIIAIIALILGIVGIASHDTVVVKSADEFGGTTADDWNVGGNLDVTGTGTIDGAMTGGSSLTLSGALSGVTTLSASGAASLSSTLTVSGDSVLADVITNGGIWATTTGAAGTVTADKVCDYEIWKITLDDDVAATTLTLPSTTDSLYLDCFSANGKSKKIWAYNSTTTIGAATDEIVTFSAPANGGIDMMSTSTDTVYEMNINQGYEIDWRRIDNTTTTAAFGFFE